MQLFSSPASPFVRKVRIAVRELGMEAEVEEVRTPVSPAERNADYATVTPLRLVPSLRLDDGLLLQDSTVILLYLDERSGGGLLPAGAARWEALARHGLAQGMLEAAVAMRYETTLRPEDLRWDVWIADKWSKIADTLDWFEARPETTAGRFDMPQIALASLLFYLDFRFDHRQWRNGYPRLAAWAAEVSERPSMAATVPHL